MSPGSRAAGVIWPSGLINPVILRAAPVGARRRPPNSPPFLSAWESSWDLGPIFADGARDPPSEEEIVLSPAWKIFQVPDPKIWSLGVGAKCVLGPREHFWPWNLGTLFRPNFSKCNLRFFYVALRRILIVFRKILLKMYENMKKGPEPWKNSKIARNIFNKVDLFSKKNYHLVQKTFSPGTEIFKNTKSQINNFNIFQIFFEKWYHKLVLNIFKGTKISKISKNIEKIIFKFYSILWKNSISNWPKIFF